MFPLIMILRHLIIYSSTVRRLQPCTNTHVKHKTQFLLPMFIANSHDSSSCFGAKETFLFTAECCFFDVGIIRKRLFEFFFFCKNYLNTKTNYIHAPTIVTCFSCFFLIFSCCFQYIS